MLPFVLHLLGDLLEIGSRSCELRRLSVLQQDFQGPQRAPFLRTSSTLQMLCIDQVTPFPSQLLRLRFNWPTLRFSTLNASMGPRRSRRKRLVNQRIEKAGRGRRYARLSSAPCNTWQLLMD